jgi:predicted DCC family thiol-disulfide oxidoreductase YuxK
MAKEARRTNVAGKLLVLFDGVCQFCNSSVHFIIDHDPQKRCVFAALQSPLGEAMKRRFGLRDGQVDSLILIENKRCYVKTTAALRIARFLSFLWRLLSLFIMIPQAIRDPAYDWFARHRYAWFGRLDQCRTPTPELRERFVDLDWIPDEESVPG